MHAVPPESPRHAFRAALSTLAVPTRSPRHGIATICVVAGALLALCPPASLSPEAARPAGLAVGAIGL